MQTDTTSVFEEYNKAKKYKESLGEKGLSAQAEINARFYSGNQWYGANCGNERPLVRHNIIKRIGDFKMSQIAAEDNEISFFAQGVERSNKNSAAGARRDEGFTGEVTDGEINAVCDLFADYYKTTAERVGFTGLTDSVLRQAYLSGSGVLYTYFDGDADTGVKLDGKRIKGDIACESLNIRDVYFADAAETDVEAQPYIILAADRDKASVLREAERYGSPLTEQTLKADENGKVTVLTKLFKVYSKEGASVHCVKVTGQGVLRGEFDTLLHRYPVAVFRFGQDDNCAYGESEVTYLIPNQIAVNRMITASVWSNVSLGMPMMIVNGDTVSGEITNDPGQVIKIYGTNEDVAGAVKYVAPPDFSAGLNNFVNDLILNTLTQSGATPAALGDEQAQNASAIGRLQSAAVKPLDVIKWRFKEFLRQNACIWADFWLNLYGNRRIKARDENGIWYFPFNSQRYKDIRILAFIKSKNETVFSPAEKAAALGELFDRGVITKTQYVSRLPGALIPDKEALLEELGKEETDET